MQTQEYEYFNVGFKCRSSKMLKIIGEGSSTMGMCVLIKYEKSSWKQWNFLLVILMILHYFDNFNFLFYNFLYIGIPDTKLVPLNLHVDIKYLLLLHFTPGIYTVLTQTNLLQTEIWVHSNLL